MNILQRTILEVKIGDRFYNLECAPDAPLNEVYQAVGMINNYIISRIEEAKKIEEEKKQEPETKE